MPISLVPRGGGYWGSRVAQRLLKRQLMVHGFRVLRQADNWVPFIPKHCVDDIRMRGLALTGAVPPDLAVHIIVLAHKESKE